MTIRDLSACFTEIVFILFVVAAHGSPASAADIQVVQSVPLETTLAVPGIPETQQVWLDMISSAQTTLDFEQFYVTNQAGQSLDPVIQAIETAAARGVKVRFLVDAKFYSQYPDSVKQLGQSSNCVVRTIDFSSLGGVQHAKYFIADEKDAFVGSQNFDWRSLSHIHEVGLRVTGDDQVNADLELIFEKDWAQGHVIGQQTLELSNLLWNRLGTLFTSPEASPIYVAASPAQVNPSGIPDSLTALTQLMGSAQKSIQIQVMEYTTSVYGSSAKWKALDTAVRQAASRGVHVQLMVDVSDLKTGKVDLQGLAKLKNVQVRSVTIPRYSGGAIPYARLIHSKYMIVDGSVGWVGSENWSESYFTDTRNVGLVVQAQAVVGQLGQIFSQVWGSSYASQM